MAASLFALASPERVAALCLAGGGGLGREVSPALARLSEPLLGRWAWPGAGPRPGRPARLGKALLLFGHPWRIPAGWLAGQYRLTRWPGFLDATRPRFVTRSTAGDSGGCCWSGCFLDNWGEAPLPEPLEELFTAPEKLWVTEEEVRVQHEQLTGDRQALRFSPRTWTDSDVGAIRAYTDMLGQLIGLAGDARHEGELAGQLQSALESWVLIEHAKRC